MENCMEEVEMFLLMVATVRVVCMARSKLEQKAMKSTWAKLTTLQIFSSMGTALHMGL